MTRKTSRERNNLKGLIDCAHKREVSDIVLKGGNIVNVFTREVIVADIAIFRDRIAGIGTYKGRYEKDCTGLYILPGFIDGHIHLESTNLTPLQFARVVLPHGTTAVVTDPHEIANVAGIRGVKWLLRASKGLPIDFFFMAPSCVPASNMEQTGIKLTYSDIKLLCKEPAVLGLAEVMDISAVIGGRKDILKKLNGIGDCPKDGHAPLLSGPDLNAYAAAGIGSDHESTSYDEALEKMRLGLHVMIREGSLAKNMHNILRKKTIVSERSFFCSDDILAQELVEEGHMDRILRRAVRLGVDPIEAVRMVTVNTATYFGLRQRGGIAPGYLSDMVAVKDLKGFSIHWVMKGGLISSKRERSHVRGKETPTPAYLSHSVTADKVTVEEMSIKAKPGKIRVIGLEPDSLLTRLLRFKPKVKDGTVVSDTEHDLIKIVVRNRHRRFSDIGIGFVQGFGMKHGALASSISHDSHNLIAAGIQDEDIAIALNHLIDINGGMVVVSRGRILKALPLPIGGLLSDRNAGWVINKKKALDNACRSLGIALQHPFITLSFLTLSVIPKLKITDRGLLDVTKGRIVGLFDVN